MKGFEHQSAEEIAGMLIGQLFFSAVSIFWIMATCCCPVSNYTHYYCVSHKNWGMFINSRECPFLFFMGKIWDLSHTMSFSTCSQGILIAKNKGDLKIAQTTYPKTLLRRAQQWYSEFSPGCDIWRPWKTSLLFLPRTKIMQNMQISKWATL